MSPLASCEVDVGAHSARVVDGDAAVHGVVEESDGDVVHDVVEEGGGEVVHGVVEEGDGDIVHDVVEEGGGEVVPDDVGEDDSDDVHDVVEEGGGGGVHGVEVVHTVGVVVEVGGETVEEGVCKVHVQNAAQEGNKVQAGNDHWVKSRHLGHCGIAMQDKENKFLSQPVGSMVMITTMICKKQV